MVQTAITLGPNCKRLEHNWAFVALTKNQEVEMKFIRTFFMQNFMQKATEKASTTKVNTYCISILQADVYPSFKLSIKVNNFHIQQNENKAGNYANCYETSCKLETKTFCNEGFWQLMQCF